MTSAVQSFSWNFCGPLGGLPPALAWTLLASFGLAGAAWIVLGYQRTLVALPVRQRLVLISLRCALWLLLLAALAGPTRIERTFAGKETRPLAVVLDRSTSMTTADNRGARRADDALRRWHTLAPVAREIFGEPRAFAFADDFVSLPETDAQAKLNPGRTRMFGSLQRTLAEAPAGGWGAIVVLTDGLDTSGEEIPSALDETARAALAAGTPIFVLPGRNRFSGGEFIAVRNLIVPAQVPPRSRFMVELTVESHQTAARTVPVRLRLGERWHVSENLALSTGRRAVTWSAELPADEPGDWPLELIVGEGAAAVSSCAEVRIGPSAATRILYYQGALDWGYRFLSDILRRDPAFALTPVFNLAPPGANRSRSTPPGALPDLPETTAGFDSYDIVVLANATADRFSESQQNALAKWVEAGGVLVFLAPDTDSSRGYAGTELERLLPVTFGDPSVATSADETLTSFRRKIQHLGSDQELEVAFASGAKRDRNVPKLAAFAWEPNAGNIIGTETVSVAPRFARHARIEHAKSGATVLARHSNERGADGTGAILLAVQRYGRGQSAVLASDALWRWKLNQPSAERGVELFWQNLLGWLVRERPHGPRFERAPASGEAGREVMLHVSGGRNPQVEATREGHPPVSLPPTHEQAGARLHRWTPPSAGMWLLTATDEDNRSARHWLSVRDAVPLDEDSGLPADETLIQELARRTGGAVLENAPPPDWLPALRNTDRQLLHEKRTPLWHGGPMLFVMLGLYGGELLLRRRWRLL
jgi:hypothetical protein